MAILAGFHGDAPTGRANPVLPRTIGRRAWLAYQHALRDAADRESAGLPHHPANDLIDCPDCDGAGCHTVNDTNPFGYGPDPQCDRDETCVRCGGDGLIVDGRIDPLVLLRRQRYWLSFRGLSKAARMRGHYNRMRQLATGPSLGMGQLRMIEAAIRCDVACRDATAAWRRAAA